MRCLLVHAEVTCLVTDGQMLFSGGDDGHIRMFELTCRTMLRNIDAFAGMRSFVNLRHVYTVNKFLPPSFELFG